MKTKERSNSVPHGTNLQTEFLSPVMTILVFWDVTPYILVESFSKYGGSSKTAVTFHLFVRRHNPEDVDLQVFSKCNKMET
jgi:hypothetical protein